MKTRDKEVTASNALFIRLGKGSSFFEKCRNNGQVMLDYREVDHQLCVDQKWDGVIKHFVDGMKTNITTAKNHVKQVKYFYTANSETIWITFHDNKMWWCKADKDIEQISENLKIKSSPLGWSDRDINGNILYMSNINGRITAKRGFLGTICEYDLTDTDYIIRKINGRRTEHNDMANECFQDLEKALMPLIQSLTWSDFELLIDLIIRHVGWERVSKVGGTQKTLDIDLVDPLTGDRAWVQVKSRATKKEYEEYKDALPDNGKLFFFAHSPAKNLIKYKKETANTNANLLFAEEIAKLAMSAGLANWIITRTQ
ncbi:MAG: hypothetical protein CVU48_03635 [Candidatus Cloacimonetes bacterium HGW-Cloacimonetes-1]|jgi:hypothetical protein|nr:MAG: hypothetical protein CVU48_03635 [Candidatus Cloacimonetes bacterium HGW-Cloacimonetes-1]